MKTQWCLTVGTPLIRGHLYCKDTLFVNYIMKMHSHVLGMLFVRTAAIKGHFFLGVEGMEGPLCIPSVLKSKSPTHELSNSLYEYSA